MIFEGDFKAREGPFSNLRKNPEFRYRDSEVKRVGVTEIHLTYISGSVPFIVHSCLTKTGRDC